MFSQEMNRVKRQLKNLTWIVPLFWLRRLKCSRRP
jgi:hypothetical protein